MRQQNIFRALSDVQRRTILEVLKDGELSVGDIATHFDITKATLSHHLSILKQADLVRVSRRGQQRIYSLNTSVIEEALAFLMAMVKGIEGDK